MSGIYLGDKPTKTTAVVNADEIPLLDSQDLSSGRKKVKKVRADNLKASIGGVQSIVAGSGVSVNNDDPANPVVSNSVRVYAAYINFNFTEPPTIDLEVFNNAFTGVTIAKDNLLDGFFHLNYTNTVNPSKILLPSKIAIIDESDTLCSLLFFIAESNKISIDCKDSNGTQFNLLQGSFPIKIEIYP